MPSTVEKIDDFQRRHTFLGFPIGVVYKFFDNQSNYLAATITYYGFAAVFPLLLISSSILGFVFQGSPQLRDQVLDSALQQFPIVGETLGSPNGLQGSTWAIVSGALMASYGIIGLGQAVQNAIHVAWATPRNSRANPFLARFHSAVFMLIAGVGVLGVSVLSIGASNFEIFGVNWRQQLGWAIDVVAVVLTAAVLVLLMQFVTPNRQRWRFLWPGALFTGVIWQLLQKLGGVYVSNIVSRASALNALFAVTLGLLALIYVLSNVIVMGIQINVVIAKRLWPRALLTPFTDAVVLTDADKRAYAAYAKMQRHKGFERVQVIFDPSDSELSKPLTIVSDKNEPQAKQAAGD